MKTVILPNTIKDIVIKNTLMKNNSLFDVEYITLDTFIKRIIQSEDNLYDIYLKLRSLSLNDLKRMGAVFYTAFHIGYRYAGIVPCHEGASEFL